MDVLQGIFFPSLSHIQEYKVVFSKRNDHMGDLNFDYFGRMMLVPSFKSVCTGIDIVSCHQRLAIMSILMMPSLLNDDPLQ